MAVSALFSKVSELEKRIEELSNLGSSGLSSSSSPSVPSVTLAQFEDMINRMGALESKLSSVEGRLLPADLPDKVSTLENVVGDFRPILIANVNDIKSMTDRLNHLESITMPHILTRLENLEHKISEPA